LSIFHTIFVRALNLWYILTLGKEKFKWLLAPIIVRRRKKSSDLQCHFFAYHPPKMCIGTFSFTAQFLSSRVVHILEQKAWAYINYLISGVTAGKKRHLSCKVWDTLKLDTVTGNFSYSFVRALYLWYILTLDINKFKWLLAPVIVKKQIQVTYGTSFGIPVVFPQEMCIAWYIFY
jgi:hypothetical protein